MASKICVQSSVDVHPQYGFNNWQNFLHSQLKPKLVLRPCTQEEFQIVKEYLEVYVELFTEKMLSDIFDEGEEQITFINLNLNHMKVRTWVMEVDSDEDTIAHGRVIFEASIVRLDRNGDPSQLTGFIHKITKKIHY